MQNALHRTPCLETAQVKMLLNGPESFTLDGNFLLGEAPELRGYFVCAGFNSAGIANAGGAGRLIAEWIVGGRAAVRRLGRRHPPLRAVARQPPAPRRSHRRIARPALRDALAARGARHGAAAAPLAALRPAEGEARGVRHQAQLGARELFPAATAPTEPPYTLDTPAWLPWMLDEQRACREDVVVFDQTSFAKFVLKGRDALAVLERLCANRIDVDVGRMVYTAMLNERGGFESDLTITRIAAERILHPHRIGAGDARFRVDRAAHRRRRARGAGRRHERLFGAVGDGAARRSAAAQRSSRDDLSQARHCRSRRRG